MNVIPSVIGMELEGFLFDKRTGKPVNTLALLGGADVTTGMPFEKITTDMAESSVELVTTPCRNGRGILESLNTLIGHLPKSVDLVLKPRPIQGLVKITDKKRARVMREALLKEQPEGALPPGLCGIDIVAPWCATHVHIKVPDVLSDEAVLLLNILNESAPYARQKVITMFGIRGTEGHSMIWQKWCDQRRLPASRWFKGAKELTEFVGGIPLLVVDKDGTGDWQLGNGELSKLGDAGAEGTLWWMARPRAVYGTLEWRPFPPVEKLQAVVLADEVLNLVSEYWSYIGRYPHAVSEWMRRENDYSPIKELFAELSKRSALVPPKMLSFSDEWWQLYRM